MKISVIIPVRNEEKSIKEVLDSLLAQSKAPDEIVITDGGSTDATAGIIRSYIQKGAPIRLICVKSALPGRARNIAIASARHEIIAMTDAGVRLNCDWLEKLIKPFALNPPIEIVYGVHGDYEKTLFERCFRIVYIMRGRIWNGRLLRFPYLGSLAMKKYVWEKAGKFREDLRATEDLIFFHAIGQLGFEYTVAPEAVAFWRPRSSLKEAFVLAFKYSACDAYSMFLLPEYTVKYTFKYIRKYVMYGTGLFLLIASFRHPVLFFALALGFVINGLFTCKKHWEDFCELVGRKPRAYFIILSIIFTLDVASLCGFFAGVLTRNFRGNAKKSA